MKGLIYYRINQDEIANVGVHKKCIAQVDAFRNLGVQADLVLLSDKGVLLNDQLVHTFSKPLLSNASSKYSFFFFNLLPIISKHINFKLYDFIYFRYALSHPSLIRFLQAAKKEHPALKIITEMPTYPYEKEKRSLIGRLSLLMDQYYRKKLAPLIDSITHYGLEKEIFGIPTIPISNGIAVQKIKRSTSQPKTKKIRLIAVANWSYWHGLDRLIKGLKNYYEQKNQAYIVILKIIGHGKAIPGNKALVIKYGLEKIVHFFPPMTNKELDTHFDEADMGIGTLGIHRKDIRIDSSLKHREYCARGLPFLLAGNDLDFPDQLSFVLKSTPTDDPIEVNNLVRFWKKLLKNNSIKGEIRQYAEGQLGWEKRMKKVINFIKKQE